MSAGTFVSPQKQLVNLSPSAPYIDGPSDTMEISGEMYKCVETATYHFVLIVILYSTA